MTQFSDFNDLPGDDMLFSEPFDMELDGEFWSSSDTVPPDDESSSSSSSQSDGDESSSSSSSSSSSESEGNTSSSSSSSSSESEGNTSSSSSSSSSSTSVSSGSGEPRPTRRPCECKNGRWSCGIEETGNPVHIHHGEIRLAAEELSSGGYGLTWGHSRSYMNRLPESMDFGNGYNWLVPQWPHVEEESAGTLVVEFAPDKTYWFDVDGQNFVGRYGIDASLSHDAESDLYTLRFDNGQTWEFLGLEAGTPHPGQLKRAVGAAGQVSEVVSYTATDRIAEVQRTYPLGSGSTTVESFVYEYTSGGDSLERLQQVMLRRRPEGLDWQPVARVSYVYYDGSTTHGSLGDLQSATRQLYDGSSWVDSQVRYYRYYKQGDANGFAHGLKYALEPQAYQKMVADGHTPATASEGTLAGYASYYFEYDAQRRVTKETIPGGRSTTFTRTARPQPHATGMNEWTVKTVVVRPDGAELVVYGNELGQPIVKELNQGADTWVEHWQYDDEGRMTLHATPAAVADYDNETGPSSLVLDTDDGLIELFDYYATTTTGSGGYAVAGYLQYEKIRQGTGGTAITLREYRYTEQSAGGVTVYPAAKTITFRNDNGTGAIETNYSYLWHSGTVEMLQRTTTLPAVPSDQNGSASSATRVERFDESGNLVWTRDERGFISYMEYDPAIGSVTRRIDDVDGSQLTLPSGWSTPAGGGLHLVSDYEHDALGRTTQVLGAPHDVDGTSVRTAAWTVYSDDGREVRTAQGCMTETSGLDLDALTVDEWDAMTVDEWDAMSVDHVGVIGSATSPVTITKFDDAGRALEIIQAPRTAAGERLSMSESYAQSTYSRWTVHAYEDDLLVSTRVYHAIPTSGSGSAGTHYNETTYGFDSMQRQNRTRSPGGTITRTVFDVRSNPISVYVGTDDTSATESDPTGGGAQGNTMKLVAEYEYDDGVGCGCGPGLTGGNLTEEVQHLDASTWRTTRHLFDWRNRRTHTLLPADDQNRLTFSKNTYDNLDRVVKVERYHDTASDGVDPDGEQNPDDVLIARQETFFDELGRVYRTKTYAVDPSNGTVGNALVANTWFDAAGNAIKQQPAGSQGFSKTAYDGLGRTVKQYVGYDTDETSYADAGTVAGDTILEQSENNFDAAGNVTLVTARQRLHNATGTGELTSQSGAQPKARVSYVAHWYDELGRRKATANYGTNGGSALSRPSTVPDRSDDVLVSSTEYNDRGEAYAVTDPAGREDRQEFDDAGRVVRTIQNYVDGAVNGQYPDEDVTVETTYSPDGQVLMLVAKNPTTGDQTTRYVYGTTLADSTIARSDLLRAVIYPDSDDTTNPLGNGVDTIYDRVELKYNRQGEVTERKDQNGTVHQYLYDALGQQTADKVTTVGTGVDGAVRRIERSYEVRGMLEKTTSYDAATGGNAVNEVVFECGTSVLLSKEYQEHSGAKDGNTLYAGYNYDTTASAGAFNKGLRPSSVRYPNGRLVHFTYGTAGEAGDAMSRLAAINDDNSGTPGNSVAEYTYLGLRTIVVEDYPQADVKLDYDSGTAGEYGGFDRFGRVVDHLWRDYGASADRDRYTYGYDRASNRLYRENTTASGKDEFYGYDDVNRLVNFDRGDLNAGKTAISGTPVREEDWTLDFVGNWPIYVEKTSGTTDLDQSRTQNKVNEIAAISAATGTNWADPVYDRAGNMTTIPKPASLASGLTAVYDGWNRLVEVKDGETVIGQYHYDGFNRRIRRDYDSGAPANPSGVDTYVHYLYNSKWQILETRDADSGTVQTESIQPKQQYVWSPRYIDAAILRDDNNDQDGLCDDARFYYLADANFHVTALVDVNGDAVERYLYAPYGTVTIYDGAWTTTRSTTSFANNVLYTGREYDPETGLCHYRNRNYAPRLGAFLSRDPINGDPNPYRYCRNNPVVFLDPSGLREAASPFEYVAGAMILRIEGPRDGAAESGDTLSSSMTLYGHSILAQFRDKAGCCLCTKVGFVQIAKNRLDITMGWWGPSLLWLDLWGNRDWFVDGNVPYKGKSIDPCRSVHPKVPRGDQVIMTDLPGIHTGSYWFGSNVHYFSQLFETHLVCLEGLEKGATYGGVQWGHSFTIKPGFYVGSSIDKYNVNRWATQIATASAEFKKLAGAALGVTPE